MNKNYYIYILANTKNTVLYIGVTNNLDRRIYEHKQGSIDGFTKKYNVTKLIYIEEYSQIEEALHREKCLKRWKREWKEELINKQNPNWDDYYESKQIPAFAGMTKNRKNDNE